MGLPGCGERRPTAPARSLVLTFDKGFRSFLTLIAPLLAERGMTATVFLEPEQITDTHETRLPRFWTPMDTECRLAWDEVGALRREGIDFGVYAGPHARSRTPDDAREALRRDRDMLASRLGEHSLPLAFPFGANKPDARALATELQFSCVLGCGHLGFNHSHKDAFALRRIYAREPGSDDVASFAAQLSGLKRWYWRATRTTLIER